MSFWNPSSRRAVSAMIRMPRYGRLDVVGAVLSLVACAGKCVSDEADVSKWQGSGVVVRTCCSVEESGKRDVRDESCA